MQTRLEQDDSIQEFTGFNKPEEIPTSQQWKNFFYNNETRAFMGRTAESWARILLFYAIFYAALATLFAIMMWVFFQTLDPRIPKWQTDRSLIGNNPGLGFRPMPPFSSVESTLITYRGTDQKDFAFWKNSLIEFLEVYRKPGLTPGRGQNIANCDYDHPPRRGQVCDVDVRNWSPCTSENHFNYHKSAPCIFLKLNKIYGWVPEYYNDSRFLPDDMPRDLKRHIREIEQQSPKKLNTVWVSCEGENPADVENIGRINYLPAFDLQNKKTPQGFPGYFYPFENSEGYLSPLMAVHFESPRNGILMQIECKAWARNIRHSRKERLGSVHFELMID